jgi:TDG/mug DNA glycosylase family protein
VTNPPSRPTRQEIDAARGGLVRDVLGPGLRVVFCGINPGLYSAAVGHHFARPGNRFWKALHVAGFTDRLLSPSEDGELLHLGLGLTNIEGRATAAAAELTAEELREGARALERNVGKTRPRAVAVLGVTAYRTAFERPRAVLGPQPGRLGASTVWVLPNPSGLNAHHQLDDLARRFAELRRAVDAQAVGDERSS